MKSITFGCETFRLKTIVIPRQEFHKICRDPKYQARYEVDYDREVRKIVESCRTSGAECFNPNMIVRPYKTGYMVLDGDHRCGALEFLPWKELALDVLQGSESDYWLCSRLANNKQVYQQPFTTLDKQVIAAELKTRKKTNAQIAVNLGLSEASIPSYISKGNMLRQRRVNQLNQLTKIDIFKDGKEAIASCLQLYNEILDQEIGTWANMSSFVKIQFNTVVKCAPIADNEILSLEYLYRAAEDQNQPFRSLAMLYKTANSKNTRGSNAVGAVQAYRKWHGDRFEAVDLTPKLNRVDRRTILSFLEAGIIEPDKP